METLIEALLESMKSQLAGGVIALSLVGSIFAFFRYVPRYIASILRRQFLVNVDVLGQDPLFPWLKLWLNNHPYTQRARSLTASAGRRPTTMDGEEVRKEKTPILFTPAPGHHIFFFRGRPVWLSRERKEIQSERGGFGGYQETINLRTFGRRAGLLRDLLIEARDMATVGELKVGIFVSRWSEWYKLTDVMPRPLESVVLPDGDLEKICSDVEEFLGARQWYDDRGVPWRRGYLFEGLPGTGKSTAIGAVAGHYGMDLYIASIVGYGMSDEKLSALLLSVPERSVVLLEDVDCVVKGREMKNEEAGVTFAGFLNALDGVASRTGVLTFMTTNNVELLDPALVRHGRVDFRMTFRKATEEQIYRYVQHFYRERVSPATASFIASLMAGSVIADVQGLLLAHKDNPEAVVALLAEKNLGA